MPRTVARLISVRAKPRRLLPANESRRGKVQLVYCCLDSLITALLTIRGADTTFLLSDGKLSQLNENQEAERWDCLFLTLTEFDHVLAYAKGLARYPFT